MLESCRLEQSSSAAAPVLGCKVLCHSGEPFPRMSPSLLNTGLALTEGSISSSPHETGSGACQGQAVLLDHRPCFSSFILHKGTEYTSAPISITSCVSAQQPQHAGHNRAGKHLHTQLLPCSMGTSCFPAFSVCFFCHRRFQSAFQKKYLRWQIAFGRTREAFIIGDS